MLIPTFSVKDHRSIVLAECSNVPPLMLVVGPNGCGKSTLLHKLHHQHKDPAPIYIGPHRLSARSQPGKVNLVQGPADICKVLAGRRIKLPPGTSARFEIRDPWSVDEGVGFTKHCLCQIEFDRRDAVTASFDRHGAIPEGAIPDPWTPLRRLTARLLPHLQFKGIDTSQAHDIRCNWIAHDRATLIDFDDLSSGEKTVIQLCLPLIQAQIRELLDEMRGVEPGTSAELCVLIDEPELHLHPSVQIKLFDYFRELAGGGRAQFILATQSESLAQYATCDELYLLRPSELVEVGANQVVQIATDDEKLETLRALYGTTSNLTSMRTIVVVEGPDDDKGAKQIASDQRLLSAMEARFNGVTLISGGGKSECIKLQSCLRTALLELSDKLQVFALLDRDVSEELDDDSIALLPVSMIENFFLDPEVIWDAIESVRPVISIKSVDDLAAALDQLLEEHKELEIARRVTKKLGSRYFRLTPPLEEADSKLAHFKEELTSTFSSARIDGLVLEERERVDQITTKKKRREYFDGKAVITSFIQKYLHSAGLKKEIFLYQAAKRAGSRKSVKAFFNSFFDRLGIPNSLGDAASSSGTD